MVEGFLGTRTKPSEIGETVPFCSEDSAKSGQSPPVLLEFFIKKLVVEETARKAPMDGFLKAFHQAYRKAPRPPDRDRDIFSHTPQMGAIVAETSGFVQKKSLKNLFTEPRARRMKQGAWSFINHEGTKTRRRITDLGFRMGDAGGRVFFECLGPAPRIHHPESSSSPCLRGSKYSSVPRGYPEVPTNCAWNTDSH